MIAHIYARGDPKHFCLTGTIKSVKADAASRRVSPVPKLCLAALKGGGVFEAYFVLAQPGQPGEAGPNSNWPEGEKSCGLREPRSTRQPAIGIVGSRVSHVR